MSTDEERLFALEQQVTSLQERVAALEGARNTSPVPLAPPIPSTDFGTLHLMQSRQGPSYSCLRRCQEHVTCSPGSPYSIN